MQCIKTQALVAGPKKVEATEPQPDSKSSRRKAKKKESQSDAKSVSIKGHPKKKNEKISSPEKSKAKDSSIQEDLSSVSVPRRTKTRMCMDDMFMPVFMQKVN